MRHIKQLSNWDCGATVFRMLTGCNTVTAIKECKTTQTGTYIHNVSSALKKRGLKNTLINVELPFECVFTHLKLLSKEYSIYISAEFVCNSGRGRNSHHRHAIGLKNETIFDPSQKDELPMDCIGHLYNKSLIINDMILVGI